MRSEPARGERHATTPASAARWLPWLLAAVAFAFDVAAFWPGAMSFDSAYAWWQARGGATSDIAPPTFVLALRLCDAVGAGPWLLFAIHLALYWSGAALLARALDLDRGRCAIAFGVLALAPLPLVLRGHVWTDVGLFCASLFAFAALLCARRNASRGWYLAALPALFYAAALRFNAWPALLPLLAFAAWSYASHAGGRPRQRLLRSAALTISVSLLFAAGISAINRNVERRVALWPLLAEFDLAAVSIADEQMLLPDFMIGPGLDVADLAQAFRVWSATALLTGTRHGVRDPFMSGFSDDQLDALRRVWLKAIEQHPAAWLGHRWRVVAALAGTHAADWPRELIYVDAQTRYRDNPPIAANTSAVHALLMRGAERLRATAWLAAWPYLSIGLAVLPFAWRHRREAVFAAALVLLASAWAYALPLFVLAPSAEVRYLGWPCVASLLATLVIALARRQVHAAPH